MQLCLPYGPLNLGSASIAERAWQIKKPLRRKLALLGVQDDELRAAESRAAAAENAAQVVAAELSAAIAEQQRLQCALHDAEDALAAVAVPSVTFQSL